MKKLLIFLILFLSLLVFSRPSYTQGMMGRDQSSTAQDEAAGKAVWDKLQNKQVICKDLKDDDFDVLGDFFMGNMMGSNHASMNQLMTQRLGQDGEKQMHIAMGKRLSGCNTNASFPQGSSYFMPMMGYNGYGNMMSEWGIIGLIISIALLLFLILGIIYFWKEITKKK